MVERLTPDLCVIGAGAAGLSVAVGAARFGVPVVLVERGRMGGDCLNYGCVPSKALLAAARRANALGELGRYGIKVQRPKVDFLDVHAHVEGVIRTIAPTDSKERMAGLGIRVVSGSARFIDMRMLMVGDDVEIRPRRTIIATGSEPAIPPIPGLSETPYLTNRTIFELTKCPRHLIVIGGGPIGIELAQAHRRLGAEVTVLEAATPLPKDDPECAAIVLDRLARDGVVVRANVKVVRVDRAHPRIRVVFACDGREETIEGSHLLLATGRRSNFEGLGLDAAGIAHSRDGIAVDKRLRTSNRRVYAIGDAIAGGLKFTHAANMHAGLVIRNALFRLPIDVHKAVVPWVTYTDPELAQVGLREDEARRRHRAIRILRWPYHENDRAQAEGETEGHVKIVTTKRGRILGVTIVGAHAGELITAWTLAINQRLKVAAWLGLVVPYPTLAEAGKRAALNYYGASLTNTWVRRIIALLRRFG